MSNTLTPEEAIAIGGIAGGIFATFAIIALFFYVLLVIAEWKIFEKAGEKGWKAIIPIYNVYIMFKIVNMTSWFWWSIAVSICASLTFTLNGFNPYNMTTEQIANYNFLTNPAVLIVTVVSCIIDIYIAITYAYRTSKVFGHGIGYTFGLLLLPNIFLLILGFGSSKYNKKALKS
ncbi:MAG: DUF5684 domain-containing protein [Candidatus Saccharimonadaceae bacterium]|nr:DUF5684 domain-containing protein [Candidatus Saccharimonadaceae bacterium]